MIGAVLSCVTAVLVAVTVVPDKVAVTVKMPLSSEERFNPATDQLPEDTCMPVWLTKFPLGSVTTKFTV